MMVQMVSGGYKVVGECTDIDSAYLEPYRADEKALGIGN